MAEHKKQWNTEIEGQNVEFNFLGSYPLSRANKATVEQYAAEDVKKGNRKNIYTWDNFNQCATWEIKPTN